RLMARLRVPPQPKKCLFALRFRPEIESPVKRRALLVAIADGVPKRHRETSINRNIPQQTIALADNPLLRRAPTGQFKLRRILESRIDHVMQMGKFMPQKAAWLFRLPEAFNA